MIPASFQYRRPASAAETLNLLAQHRDNALLLAGGQSLIPMMKLRFARPELVIDINGLPEWRGISINHNTIRIGAAATQDDIIASQTLAKTCPLLRETALQIADPQVRARGAIGGNAANGDPGNDMPATLIALDAEYELSSAKETRTIKARNFYKGPFDTERRPDEALSAILIQATPGGSAYIKQKRKIGDYATAAAAVVIQMEKNICAAAAIALTNAAPTPLLLPEAAKILEGSPLNQEDASRAAQIAENAANPASDERGPAQFRKKLAGIMVRRALTLARERASQ